MVKTCRGYLGEGAARGANDFLYLEAARGLLCDGTQMSRHALLEPGDSEWSSVCVDLLDCLESESVQVWVWSDVEVEVSGRHFQVAVVTPPNGLPPAEGGSTSPESLFHVCGDDPDMTEAELSCVLTGSANALLPNEVPAQHKVMRSLVWANSRSTTRCYVAWDMCLGFAAAVHLEDTEAAGLRVDRDSSSSLFSNFSYEWTVSMCPVDESAGVLVANGSWQSPCGRTEQKEEEGGRESPVAAPSAWAWTSWMTDVGAVGPGDTVLISGGVARGRGSTDVLLAQRLAVRVKNCRLLECIDGGRGRGVD